MSQRGRGCLEIRPSDSAFYRTTTSEIGDTVVREREYDDVAEHEIAKEGTSSATQSFAFLYTRESDKIGSKVRMGGDTNQMSLTSKRGPGRNRFASTRDEIPEHGKPITVSPALILANYKQGTKIEDPRFTTTSNEYGKKAPTIATFVSERSIRPQGFSKSFQNVNPKNSTLNTSVTKSNVHPNLDPQFA